MIYKTQAFPIATDLDSWAATDQTSAQRPGWIFPVLELDRADDRPLPHFESGEPICYVVALRAERPIKPLRVGMTIYSSDGRPIGSAFSPEIEGG